MKLEVSLEDCLLLRALLQEGSLRRASEVIGQDQAQLTRRIQRLAGQRPVVVKVGGRWQLTEQGEQLALWAERAKLEQDQLLARKPQLRVSAFGWLAQELLIPNFSSLDALAHKSYTWAFDASATTLEADLLSGRSDFVITCHAPNDPLIAHRRLAPDPWRVIYPLRWQRELGKLSGEELKRELLQRPFIRLNTSAPEQILGFLPRELSDLSITGVYGARAAVEAGLGWSCLPGFALTSALFRDSLAVATLTVPTQGDFSLWQLRSRRELALPGRLLMKWLQQLLD